MLRFPEYIGRVANHGECFVLKRADEPVAEIPPGIKRRTIGDLIDFLAALPPLTEEEAADWARDIEEMRRQVGPAGAADPWES